MTTETELPYRLKCMECGYPWNRRTDKLPKQCPDCGSRHWQEGKSAKNEKPDTKCPLCTRPLAPTTRRLIEFSRSIQCQYGWISDGVLRRRLRVSETTARI